VGRRPRSFPPRAHLVPARAPHAALPHHGSGRGFSFEKLPHAAVGHAEGCRSSTSTCARRWG
jgi:hypothetical protein